MKLDAIDRKILDLLQQDCDLQIAQIAERVGLSHTPCWRRIQRLREEKVILKNVALADPRKLNVGITVIVSVRANEHSEEWLRRFKATVDVIPEVVQFYRMSGDVDYMLRVVVPDITTYDGVYKRLIAGTNLKDVHSSFAMEEIKSTTALPVSHIA